MHILICSDAFKEAADAQQVCLAIQKGVHAYDPKAKTDLCPLADGGEGTARILSEQHGGSWIQQRVDDPLGRSVTAGFGWVSQTQTAFLDMAEASGLQLVNPMERNPMAASSYGTGQLIKAALEKGARHIYFGIGGSATTDAGMGMAKALGIAFFRKETEIEYPVAADMQNLTRIDYSGRHPLLAKARIQVLADVRNPLYGPNGAAHVFGPQKGANAEQVEQLDRGLITINSCWSKRGWSWVAEHPGAGAAGGMGAGSLVFLGAELIPGAPTIFQILDIERRFKASDLVLTGEGKLDSQSLQGKLIEHLGQLSRSTKVPMIVLCGQLDLNYNDIRQAGLRAAFALQRGPASVQHSIQNTLSLLQDQTTMILSTFEGR